MSEKIAAKVEANGATRPMLEKIPDKIEETARHYMREAENVAGDAFRGYKDLMITTTNFCFDTFSTTMRRSLEITTRAEQTLEGMMSGYQRFYVESSESWQGYWQGMNKLLARPK